MTVNKIMMTSQPFSVSYSDILALACMPVYNYSVSVSCQLVLVSALQVIQPSDQGFTLEWTAEGGKNEYEINI